MATFEVFGFDDDILPDSVEVDCPVCQKPISIPLEREENLIICPHCQAEIEIAST